MTDSFAVVDVETSGSAPKRDRVLSIAVIQMAEDLSVESTWSTLLNPNVDPGPVHVHGLTRAVLAGAPRFEDVVDELSARLSGRVLVAHNASFDSGFLSAEAARIDRELPYTGRICTVVLARRLRLGLARNDLGTLARHFGVTQRRAHDAVDDTRVLSEIFRYLVIAAGERGVPLTLLGEKVTGKAATVLLSPKVTSPADGPIPPRWAPGTPLVPGPKIALVGYGPARSHTLRSVLSEKGLRPTGSSDLEASLAVVHGDPDLLLEAGPLGSSGMPFVTEAQLFSLLRRL